MPALLDGVRVGFQPLFNLRTGGVVAVEAVARPQQGGVRELLRAAADTGQLTPTDYGLVQLAIQRAAEHELSLPLHVNLLAISVARAPVALKPVLAALHAAHRRPADVVIELNPPFTTVRRRALAQGIDLLRAAGFRLALDGIGDADLPLSMLTAPEFELIKLDHTIVADVLGNPRNKAVVRAFGQLCEQTGTQLLATGVRSPDQLTALYGSGVAIAQGDGLHPASHRPAAHASIQPQHTDTLPPTEPAEAPVRRGGPRVTELMQPAATLPESATVEQVRALFASTPDLNCVVLLDKADRPLWTLDRNRLLLAVTGPYGHALHANRTATRLADDPRLIPIGASVFDVLDVLSGSEPGRTNDDVVVIDAAYRCVGVVRATDLVRAVTDSKIEQAAALNPLTRLPGSEAIDREVQRRLRAGEVFTVGWLDIDAFKSVNDRFGFATGDDLIRQIGATLSDIAATAPSVRVGHVGGDDFLVVASLDDVMPVGTRLVEGQWSAEDHPVTVSLAMLICVAGSVSGYPEVSQLLAPLKTRAKELPGSSWVVGRPGSDRVDVLRQGQFGPRHSLSAAR